MLYHLLSLFDFLAAIAMIGGHYGLLHASLLYAALYLGGKLVFWRDALSIIDAVCAVYIVFVFFGHASILTWVFAIYFIYKFAFWAFMTFAT